MMVRGQNGAHLSEFLLRNELKGYTQGKGRGLTMACRRLGYASCIHGWLAQSAERLTQAVGLRDAVGYNH